MDKILKIVEILKENEAILSDGYEFYDYDSDCGGPEKVDAKLERIAEKIASLFVEKGHARF
jgi:hypothetical protein